MNGTISRQDFDQLSVDGKLGVIFETIQTRDVMCHSHQDKCDERITKLERRKWWDKGLAVVAAAVVALATVLGLSPK